MPALDFRNLLQPRPLDGSVRYGTLQNAKAVTDAPSGTANVFGANDAPRRLSSPDTQSRHLNAYAGGDDAIDWVMDAVSLIAETASAAPTHFEREGKTVVQNLTPEHPDGTEQAPGDLVALFSQPNAYMDWSELIELTFIDFLLTGNAWWWKFRPDKDGKPLGLFRLHPAHITIKQAKGGGISGYEYNPPGGRGKYIIKPEHMVHFKRPNPHDEHYGAGIISAAPRMFDLELYLTESQTSYYERGTRLSGVLETDGTVTNAAFEKLKNMFRSLYSGRSNAYDVAVLERGLKYNTIQNSASDAKYVEMSDSTRNRILAAFRTPLTVLGVSVEGATGQSKAEDQRLFDNKTMRPLLDKFQKKISLEVTQAWGLDFVFEYEYLPPAEDQLELAGTFAALPGVMVHEVRKMAGLDPLPQIDGKDDERNYIVLNLPGENENESEVKDRNLPGEQGRPPKGENTAAIEEEVPEDGAARARKKTPA